tara:strand:- start:11 stop:1066 length:1056 start_codon:yes stop_codon:yes gene_type:complete
MFTKEFFLLKLVFMSIYEYKREEIITPDIRLRIKDLEILNNFRPFYDLFLIYFTTILLIYLSIRLSYEASFYFYIPLIFFIAGRQGALLQLIHEASHRLINSNKKINNFFGEYLTSLLIGVNFNGYKDGHQKHHTHTATPFEPEADSDKYLIVDFRNPKIYLLFIRDILGISALRIFFAYNPNEENSSNLNHKLKNKIFFIFKLFLFQLLILSFFQFNIINYVLFWLYPAVGPHMFLMRIRGIAEHGLGKKLGYKIEKPSEGLYFTRSFLTPRNRYQIPLMTFLEKLLIGSLDVYYHHEHHLAPRVPYYNLKKIYKIIGDNIENKIDAKIYEKGYFSAAFSTVKVPVDELA